VRLGCGAHGEDGQGPIPVIGEDPVTVEPRVGPEDKPEAPLRRQVERLLKNTAGDSYTAFTNEAAFRYGLEEHFRASFGVLADYDGIHSVPGLTDGTALNFSGLSSEFRWQLMQLDVSPLDLTLSFAPQWQRIDDMSGARVESYAFPVALLADTALVPGKMFAAANLIYTPATHTNSDPLEFSPAMAGAVTDSIFLGAEIRHITRNQNGFFTGHALFIGPSLFVKLSDSMSFTAAWTAQIPDETTHRLDVVNFERHQVLAILVKNF
jgi:hypothetical protein